MPSSIDGCIVYVTLVLAAAAAIASSPARPGETSRKLQCLLLTSAVAEAAAMAGAIGEDPEALVPAEFMDSLPVGIMVIGEK
jgi:hypothetical protein